MTSDIVVSDRTPVERASIQHRIALVMWAQEGDQWAFGEYLALNKGLFESLVRRYARWVPRAQVDDLRQEGMLGLMEGIRRFDPVKFGTRKPETYVFGWVRAYISAYSRGNGTAATNHLVSENYEIGHNDGESIKLHDVLADPTENVVQDCMDREIHLMLIDEIGSLLPKEKIIARRRLFADEPETLEAIGDDLGVSRERIRQIEREVRVKVRKRLSNKMHEMWGRDVLLVYDLLDRAA